MVDEMSWLESNHSKPGGGFRPRRENAQYPVETTETPLQTLPPLRPSRSPNTCQTLRPDCLSTVRNDLQTGHSPLGRWTPYLRKRHTTSVNQARDTFVCSPTHQYP